MKLSPGIGKWMCAIGVLLAAANASADPILPYSQPIAVQLSNDTSATAQSALNVYHRSSSTLSSDVSILRSLNSLLAGSAAYTNLLSDAVIGYIGDFAVRADDLETTLLPAPLTRTKTNAFGRIHILRSRLSIAETNENRKTQLSHLAYVAGRFSSASNTVKQALRAKTGNSSVWANIGKLPFRTDPRDTAWSFAEGSLNISATNRGPFKRTLLMNLVEVSELSPATYLLATNGNEATYIAQDMDKRDKPEFVFDGLPLGPAGTSMLRIDAVTEDFIVGRFQFTAETPLPTRPDDTNRVVTVTNGFFQLNFEN
jgi:hypothetical protein